MNKNQVLDALKLMREKSKERKFKQSVDLTITFRGLDFKKPDSAISLELNLPNPVSARKGAAKALLFVRDSGFALQAKDLVARIINENEIHALKKKDAEQLASEFDVLLAEGPVMLTVAKYLGQILAPKGKMPRPVQTSIPQLESMLKTGHSLTKVSNKKGKNIPMIHVKVGTQESSDNELAENVLTVYNAVEEKLPGKKQNVRSIYLKFTMGPPVKIGAGEAK